MAEKFSQSNKFTVVGTLVSAEVKNGRRPSNGAEYVSVNALVRSNIDGRTHEYELSFYANALTQDGKESKLFISYSKMPELINKKIEVTGSMRENRYWSSNTNQLVSSQQLNGQFVRAVSDATADMATFEISGFVAKELVEKTNKNNEIYRYDITIGQVNYSGDSASMFTLHVNPTQMEIVNGVKKYQAGQTIKVTGSLAFIVEQKTVEDTSYTFGVSVTKTFTNRQRNFYIEAGSAPITDETAYPSAVIRSLIEAYKARDVEIQARAQTGGEERTPVTSAAPVTKRQTSLI